MSFPLLPNEDLIAANEDAAEFFRRRLFGGDATGPRSYLVERGFEVLLDDTRWRVGYAPAGWTTLRDHLAGLGYSDATLLAAGLTQHNRRGEPIDVFRDRITFGITNTHCQTVGFVGRRGPNASTLGPKYVNTKCTSLYSKSESLFGLSEARPMAPKQVVLAEGPLDAIAIDLAVDDPGGSVFATCGTALASTAANGILTRQPSAVVLAFDSDRAGQRAVWSAYRLLNGAADLRAATFGPGTDPAALLARHGPDAVLDSIRRAQPAADAIVDSHLQSWPAEKTGVESALSLLREVLTEVCQMRAQDVARQVGRLARTLPFDHETISIELVDAVAKMQPSRSRSPTHESNKTVRRSRESRVRSSCDRL